MQAALNFFRMSKVLSLLIDICFFLFLILFLSLFAALMHLSLELKILFSNCF